MTFLGGRYRPNFQGETTTDRFNPLPKGRLPGRRVNHLIKQKRLKMHDKTALILRVGTVVNSPRGFCARRRVRRRGRRKTAWVPLSRSAAYLFRYREISFQSDSRYLNALAQVEDPTYALPALDVITSRKKPHTTRRVQVFNPLARPENEIFAAVMSGEHAIHGFTNGELRDKLPATILELGGEVDPESTYDNSIGRWIEFAAHFSWELFRVMGEKSCFVGAINRHPMSSIELAG